MSGRDERLAIVTGAARGIGAATVRQLVADGWTVGAIDWCRDHPLLAYPMGTSEELWGLADELSPAVRPVIADVSDPPAVAEAVADLVASGPPLHAAIGVAGLLIGGAPLWELDAEAIELQRSVNLGGVMNLAATSIPHMLGSNAGDRGRFVAVASAAATNGLAGLSAYGATKAGVVGLIRGLARELGPTGITANAVLPGSTETDLLVESARAFSLHDPREFSRHSPQGRLLEADEIARAIGWLCSPESAGVNGAVLPVDGGMTA